ncbi:MAG: phenylalanine--tRNA ligase subunit beta [Rikenellaceae bacterium]|nr:phenylalanine--tRNA ligase subunit beta [Rikenellaceae bacterium]MCL2691886.1 phenylalanine--tRNA ligase subunit beta [Rikenellaceae bacterium]
MTISLNWLGDYLRTDLSPERIAQILTDIGLEVDRFEKREAVRGGLTGVVVGQVVACAKHPDADRLSVTSVDVGAGGEPLQIVCGAPNVAAGQKVLVATAGATLYPKNGEEFKIKKSKIRGVESLGMICAEDELGIGDGHDGIMVLGADAVVGAPAAEVLSIENDYIIEIGLTPNRVDAASHYGVARDVAAYLRVHGERAELTLPSVESFSSGNTAAREIAVTVEDTDGAPRYTGLTITGLRVGPSPDWLQARLRAIGLNPHNNVVDATNYVLHEVGQPLHAFDADRIEGGRIVVRTCEDGTPFTTLDSVERTLGGDDLMICSETRPMCMAGIYGGLDSGVTESTTAIFLESAYFSPQRIRRTARRHGLSTDASFRYERGADPDMAIYALKRAAMLICEIAGGSVLSPITDIYPVRVEHFRFDVSLARLNALIGKEIPRETVRAILASLGVDVERERGDILSVAVPPFRVDVQREADIAEEILRIYGYNNVEMPTQVRSSLSYRPRPDIQRFTTMVAEFLTANGFNETMSNSLTKSSYYEGLTSFPVEHGVRILNPLSADLGVMRQTLLFGMLEAVQLNANHRNPNLRLYEFGNVYRCDSARAGDDPLSKYAETQMLGVCITGMDRPASWNVKSHQTDFFTLRGVLEKIVRRFGLDLAGLPTDELVVADIFGDALAISLNGKELARMGRVAQQLIARFDIKQEVYFLEMDFEVLVRATQKHTVQVAELSKYPEVRRDLALLVDRGVTFSALRAAALAAEKRTLKIVSLFDVYEGDKLPSGKKSYALGFVLEDKTRTLTDNDINRMMTNIAARLEKDCGATVRTHVV